MYAIQKTIEYLKNHSFNIRDCGASPLDGSIDPLQEEWALEVDQIVDQLEEFIGHDDFDPLASWNDAHNSQFK